MLSALSLAARAAPRRAGPTAPAALRAYSSSTSRNHNQQQQQDEQQQHRQARSELYRIDFDRAFALLAVSALAGFGAAQYAFDNFGRAPVECEAVNPLQRIKGNAPMSTRMEALVKKIQSDMTSALEELEGPSGGRFLHDSWTRKEGGFGTSCVLQDGRVFEKAGVSISIISSPAPKTMLAHMRARNREGLDPNGDYKMFVAGVSMVVHPHNPMAPTFHANYRYFELRKSDAKETDPPAAAWFGGGCDLTPCYLFEEDAVHFHKVIKDACDKHDKSYYPRFKEWCDNYFNNTHRGERRGVGGIFFDDLEDKSPEQLYAFVSDCGNSLVKQYIPIVRKRMNMPYTQAQKEWQQLRRGRYVEFNLVHDRGTKFGLATPGVRIESVFMSLPLTARWQYNHTPAPGSPEEKLLNVLKTPREWV
ncbi:Coproporphyrinogen-III oxidase [Polyrhizophydium stewartii]|uniref:coproporphyrinogen oxidase n=1 Tax=Polyrhizophydium stewartii TaxID=2732419 RepID=A0ABR4MZ18_9FUNG|nr:Coproporphyrinogen-III oxidase [Polyrhizophydium stewartii]